MYQSKQALTRCCFTNIDNLKHEGELLTLISFITIELEIISSEDRAEKYSLSSNYDNEKHVFILVDEDYCGRELIGVTEL